MRIAIIGAGISGLTAARYLCQNHDVTVFEASSRVGGHVNTVQVDIDGQIHHIDTGFIVFNEWTYPNFTNLLRELEVESAPTSMSFSVRCDKTGLEYNGTSLNGIFAQRTNLVSPRFLRLLSDIIRFNREGTRDFYRLPEDVTVGQYLKTKQFSEQFEQQYLLPMGAAIWSCPVSQFEDFPIKFILEFYHNHGLLRIRNRPQWKTIVGGSNRYVEKMISPFEDHIRLRQPIRSIKRLEDAVAIVHDSGCEYFDEVVIACHSDQALRMLSDPDPTEIEILSAFPYSKSTAILHTDTRVLPKNRRAWASWNYHVSAQDTSSATLTYNMNILQQIESKHTFCVTLNEQLAIDPSRVLGTFEYEHPIFTVKRSHVAKRHQEMIRRRRTSYCGAYWRNGFHEDGVVSAMNVCQEFGYGGDVQKAMDSELACSF